MLSIILPSICLIVKCGNGSSSDVIDGFATAHLIISILFIFFKFVFYCTSSRFFDGLYKMCLGLLLLDCMPLFPISGMAIWGSYSCSYGDKCSGFLSDNYCTVDSDCYCIVSPYCLFLLSCIGVLFGFSLCSFVKKEDFPTTHIIYN